MKLHSKTELLSEGCGPNSVEALGRHVLDNQFREWGVKEATVGPGLEKTITKHRHVDTTKKTIKTITPFTNSPAAYPGAGIVKILNYLDVTTNPLFPSNKANMYLYNIAWTGAKILDDPRASYTLCFECFDGDVSMGERTLKVVLVQGVPVFTVTTGRLLTSSVFYQSDNRRTPLSRVRTILTAMGNIIDGVWAAAIPLYGDFGFATSGNLPTQACAYSNYMLAYFYSPFSNTLINTSMYVQSGTNLGVFGPTPGFLIQFRVGRNSLGNSLWYVPPGMTFYNTDFSLGSTYIQYFEGLTP